MTTPEIEQPPFRHSRPASLLCFPFPGRQRVWSESLIFTRILPTSSAYTLSTYLSVRMNASSDTDSHNVDAGVTEGNGLGGGAGEHIISSFNAVPRDAAGTLPIPAISSSHNQQQQVGVGRRSSENSHVDAACVGNRVSSTTSSNTCNMSNIDQKQCLTWSRISPSSTSGNVPHPRSGAASVIVQNKLYIFGGYGGGTGRLDDFHSFDFDTNSWEEVPVLSSQRPERRENNGVVIGGGTRLYLFGGYNGSDWLNDLWMFDIVTQCWECIQESNDINPASRNGGIDQHAIDIAAGNTLNNERQGDSSSLSVNGVESEHLKIRPSRRFGYVSVVHEEKFILWGGFDGSEWLNDMYEFNFRTKVWRQVEAQGELPSVRSCPAWSSNDSQLFIHGGYDGIDRKADFFACDLTTYTWKEMPCLGTPPSPRYFHSCSLYGNKMFVYGGYSGSERLSDMYAYDFETNHWSEVDCTNGDAPSGRSSLVAQVYRNCMYIFGGYNGSVVLNVSMKKS